MNVYFGGTLVNAPEVQLGWQEMKLIEGTQGSKIESLLQGRPIMAYSNDCQACQKVVPEFSVLIHPEQDGSIHQQSFFIRFLWER